MSLLDGTKDGVVGAVDSLLPWKLYRLDTEHFLPSKIAYMFILILEHSLARFPTA